MDQAAPLADAPDLSSALERARSLAPQLRERSKQTQSERRIPDATMRDLRDSGLLSLAVPRHFGGSELGMASLVSVATEISEACGSTGWVYSVFVGHSWLVSLFPPKAQQEVFRGPVREVASVVHFGGNPPRREAGGYRFEGGIGRLCSGVAHSGWILLGAAVTDGDAPPEPRYFLVPKDAFEVIDDWHTAGLRGTGSMSVRLPSAFVPEYRTLSIADLAKGAAPGLEVNRSVTYRAPFPEVLILALTGAPLGIARAALSVVCDGFRAQFSAQPSEQVAESSAVFVRLAEASAAIDSASETVLRNARRIDESDDPAAFSRLDRARLLRDYAYAVQSCRNAVNSLWEAGGSSAVYSSSPLQRMYHDINAAAAHKGFSWDRTVPTFARALLGLPPGKFEVRRGH